MIYFLFIISFSSVWAQELSPTVLKLSILKNLPLVEEARLKAEAAEGEITAAQGAFDTKLKYKHRNHIEQRYDNEFSEISIEKVTPYSGLSLLGGFRQGTGLYAPYEGKYDTSSTGEIFAGLSLPILRNRATDDFRLHKRFAEIDKKIAESEVLIKSNFYLHKGLSLYQKWQLTFNSIKTLKELLLIAEDRQEMLSKRFNAGDVEKIKLIDNERSILKRKEELLKAKMKFNKLSNELSIYVRDGDGKMMEVSAMTPATLMTSKIDLLPLKIDLLPQLKIIKLEQTKLKRLNEFYENQKLPRLNMDVLASRELSSRYPYDPEKLHIGLTFEYPFENRKAKGKTVSSEYKVLALQKQRLWIENEFLVNFKQAQELAKLALKRINIIQDELKNSKRLAEAERRRWRSGDSDLFTVALREQDAAAVEIKLLKARYELEQKILDAKLFSAALAE